MKNTSHTSIFNLIEIFRTQNKKVKQTLQAISHCKTKSLHDYYCDAETAK